MKKRLFAIMLTVLLISSAGMAHAQDAWQMAQKHKDTLRFATLFTAHNMRDYLGSEKGIEDAIQWCKQSAVSHVFFETFRGGYLVPMHIVQNAKNRFQDEGFLVSGCITTVGIGRDSVEGWIFPCFTEKGGLENLKHIFEYTAMLFDDIMIDDFYCTRCQCEECKEAKGEQSWDKFRCDMMVDVSKEYVINPTKRVNPNATIIIKYPQWYGAFQEAGYDVDRQTKMFDKTWVGTETRDPDNERWGRHPQYMAYFIMRWLGVNGGEKCGGGWFDPYGTSPETYVEQARQTILAGADEALLFCYGSLQNDNGPANVKAFRKEIPELFALARAVHDKPIRGIHAPKPPNSEGKKDRYMYDFLGMLGLPLVPAETIDAQAKAALLGHQILHEQDAIENVQAFHNAGKPVLITDTLLNELPEEIQTNPKSFTEIHVPNDKWEWMDYAQEELNQARNTMLKPFGVQFNAPSRVSLYLFGETVYGIENFNNEPVQIQLTVDGEKKPKPFLVIKKEKKVKTEFSKGTLYMTIPKRTLVLLKTQ